MGLLTDPSLTQRNKLGRNLVQHNRKICVVLYLAGLIWFCCLGHKSYNHATYLSENALSPGLVYSEIRSESGVYAQNLMEELQRERQSHKSEMPYAWLIAKLQQMGLETYTHNFTLHYQLGNGNIYYGKNVYAILRAPRIASTEGIVFSTPYRPPDTAHAEISASVPILLTFAQFARRQNYWAKDLVFLFTDQEQLGMHAWLKAYYYGGLENDTIVNAGNLKGRAGSLQAALNLEIQDFNIDYIDVKIEGLNGQLPNLDMFNLVQRLAVRENFISGHKQTSSKRRNGGKSSIQENVRQMANMLLTQSTGVPTGNHGLFHRYRIEAVTLEGVKRPSTNYQRQTAGALSILKLVEGISRSLNNLLERFHQSYFFYILVANDRFVSIGDFMPCLVLTAGPLFIKAFLLWLGLEASLSNEKEEKKIIREISSQYIPVGIVFSLAHALGVILLYLPFNNTLNMISASNHIPTNLYLFSIFAVGSLVALIMPVFVKLDYIGRELLHIVFLLELATALIVMGLLNFALGFILAIFISPLAIFLDTCHRSDLKFFSTLYAFLLQPLVFVYIAVFILTLGSFTELSVSDVAKRAITASMDAITFGVVDSIIYGNWLFNVAVLTLFPIWTMLWNVVILRSVNVPKIKSD